MSIRVAERLKTDNKYFKVRFFVRFWNEKSNTKISRLWWFSNGKSTKMINDRARISRPQGWKDGRCEDAEFRYCQRQSLRKQWPLCHLRAREILSPSFEIFKLFPLKKVINTFFNGKSFLTSTFFIRLFVLKLQRIYL